MIFWVPQIEFSQILHETSWCKIFIMVRTQKRQTGDGTARDDYAIYTVYIFYILMLEVLVDGASYKIPRQSLTQFQRNIITEP